MEGFGSTSGGSKGKKTERTRRVWTEAEEDVFMDQLKELVTKGWRTENGFKPGYALKLEGMLQHALPGTDLRCNPHINSKIAGWKKHHGCLQLAIGETGCGFNVVTKLLDCTDEAWDKVLRRDASCNGMRYKPWKYYDDWLFVFGNEKATGKTAEDVPEAYDVMDAVNELVDEDNRANMGTSIPDDVVHESTETEDVGVDVNSETPRVPQPAEVPSASKKRAAPENNPSLLLVDVLGKLCKESSEQIGGIIQVLGQDAKLADAETEIWDLVCNIEGLSLDDQLNATHILTNHAKCHRMFMRLPETARARYVLKLLAGDFGDKR